MSYPDLTPLFTFCVGLFSYVFDCGFSLLNINMNMGEFFFCCASFGIVVNILKTWAGLATGRIHMFGIVFGGE